MLWLRLPACLKSRRSRFQTRLWHSSFKKQNVSSLLTREYSILWGAGPRDIELGTRPPGLECRILSLDGSVISFIPPSSRGTQPSLAYMCTNVAKNTIHIIVWATEQ